MLLRDYEGVFIFDPGLKDQELEKCVQEVCASITSRKGEILKHERLGKRPLAYPIHGHKEGDYHILNFKASSQIISSIKSDYRLMPSIIRVMIVKP